MATHTVPAAHLAARFPSDEEARRAVADLEALRADGRLEHLQVEVHRGSDHELETAEDRMLTRVAVGMLTGVPLGILVGLLVMGAIVTLSEGFDRGFVLGVGIGAGFMFGLLVGGIGGLAWGSGDVERAREIAQLHLEDDEDVVVADIAPADDGHSEEVRRVLTDHHGRVVYV